MRSRLALLLLAAVVLCSAITAFFAYQVWIESRSVSINTKLGRLEANYDRTKTEQQKLRADLRREIILELHEGNKQIANSQLPTLRTSHWLELNAKRELMLAKGESGREVDSLDAAADEEYKWERINLGIDKLPATTSTAQKSPP